MNSSWTNSSWTNSRSKSGAKHRSLGRLCQDPRLCYIPLALIGKMSFVLQKNFNIPAPTLLFKYDVTSLYRFCVIYQAMKESACVHKGFCLTERRISYIK